MTLTYLLFSIAPPEVAHFLCSLISRPLASERCFKTWVLIFYQFLPTDPLSPVFCPYERTPSFNFQKDRFDDFAFCLDSCCPAEEYSSHSLSSATTIFTLTPNEAKFFIPFGRVKRQPQAWWSAEVEEAVSERRKAFAAAHRSDEVR